MINRFNHSQRPDLVKIEQVKVVFYSSLFHPKATKIKQFWQVFWLAQPFTAFPSGSCPTVAGE